LAFAGGPDTTFRFLAILLNGSDRIVTVNNGAQVGGSTDISVDTYYTLAAGDYVELGAIQCSGGPLDVLIQLGDLAPDFGMVKLP
jgi:hypothetical protein